MNFKKAGACNACEAVSEENKRLRDALEIIADYNDEYPSMEKAWAVAIEALGEREIKDIEERIIEAFIEREIYKNREEVISEALKLLVKEQKKKEASEREQKTKVIKVEKDAETGEHFFPLDKVLECTNMSPDDVAYYKMKEKNGTITLKLYDKNKKRIKVKNELR